MMKWIKKYWPALLLTALLVAILDGTISSLETCHPIGANPSSGHNDQINQECTTLAGPLLLFFFAIIDFTDKHGTAITGVFTIVLAAFTGRLWFSTEKLWGVTDNTLTQAITVNKREGRAYISVRPRGVSEYTSRDYLIGRIEIVNVGRIPAREVSIFSAIQHDQKNGTRSKSELPIGKLRPSPTVLQPNATMEFGTYTIGINAAGENIEGGVSIPNEQRASPNPLHMEGYLYVWGEVTYTDGLGTQGWTCFCHRYPCRMFGKNPDGPQIISRETNRSIDPRYARYHEEAGNEAD